MSSFIFAARPRLAGGFTLLEVMIAASLSSFLLAGILSAFLLIGRTSFNSSHYSELEAEGRRGLETFADDVRNASDLEWHGNQSLTLIVPTEAGGTQRVTYAYDPVAGSDTYLSFYRLAGGPDSGETRRVLVRQVAPDFSFHRYKLERPGITDNSAATNLETKQIQLTLRVIRTGVTTVEASHAVLSAGYVLRNKRVAN